MKEMLIYNVTSSVKNETQKNIDFFDKIQWVVALVAMFVILSNLIVVISSGLLFKKGFEPRCTYMLLGNISLADLITAFVVLIGWIQPRDNSDVLCVFHLSIYLMSAVVSTQSLGLIAIDRYLYIIHGIKYKQLMYPKKIHLMILGTWIIGIFCCDLPFILLAKKAPACWFTLVAPVEVILMTTILGICPLIITFISYSIILHKAISNMRRIERANNNGGTLRINLGNFPNVPSVSNRVQETEATQSSRRTESKDRNKWKAIKVVFFTTGTYSITWLPYLISSSVYFLCVRWKILSRDCQDYLVNVTSPLAMCTFLSCFTNPVIYAWWHNKFREDILKMHRKYMRLYRLRTGNPLDDNRFAQTTHL